jgi:hypothetical protein
LAIDNDILFVATTPIGVASSWDYDAVKAMRPLPEMFLGSQQPILQGDQYRLWLRWFLEGLVSPLAVSRNASLKRLDVLAAVHKRIELMYPSEDALSQRELTEKITDHLYEDVQRLRLDVNRDYADRAAKAALLAERDPPRCYICGFAFSKPAQDALLRKAMRDPVVLPKMVDVFRPRIIKRDVSIEIEHVVPVAHGGHGRDNLRLACGWCNKYKSSKVSLYEASQVPSQVPGFRMGPHEIHELPHPFWTIRVLALRRRCQHRDGCVRTADDSEMLVSLLDWGGSPNPMNLAIYCEDHDPMKGQRFYGAADVAKLWGERR